MRHTNSARLLHIIVAACLLLSGCSVGAKSVPLDRSSYGESLARSTREELLRNIIRLRYMEAPSFMSVTSVVNQYSVESTASVGTQFNSSSMAFPDRGVSLGATGKYADRPTITYAPMIGRQFAESILTPIKPSAVFALVESGWRVDMLFPMTVHSINGIRNRFYGAREQKLDPEFTRMVELMSAMQTSGTLSIRVIKPTAEGDPSFVMLIAGADDENEQAQVREIKQLLGLDPALERYKISFAAAPADGSEVAIITRSMLLILADMASYVRVPDEDVAAGRATRGAQPDPGLPFPLVVHSGEHPDDDAFIRVRHRDQWFWIADTDLKSKQTFGVLQIMSTLAESPDAPGAPLLTITPN